MNVEYTVKPRLVEMFSAALDHGYQHHSVKGVLLNTVVDILNAMAKDKELVATNPNGETARLLAPKGFKVLYSAEVAGGTRDQVRTKSPRRSPSTRR